MTKKLARIHWKLGQPLLPEHFNAQEDSLLENSEFRFRLSGLPHYGLIELKWRQQLLDDGVLSLEKFSYKTTGGLLVNIEGNAKIISPLNLGSLGKSKCSIYCHIFPAQETVIQTDTSIGEENELISSVYQLHLGTDQEKAGAIESFKIAEFSKSPDDIWELTNSYCPPLILVGSSPFFIGALKELAIQLKAFQEALVNDSAINTSTEASLSNRQCLEKVFKLQLFLNNLEAQIKVHPYELYQRLVELYIACCNYYNALYPPAGHLVYNHNNLGDDFQKLFMRIKTELQQVKAKAPYLPFNFEEGRFICHFSSNLRQASSVYLLIQKNHIKDEIDITDIKLVSSSRSIIIHKMSLPGIPLTPIENVPFQHPFGAEVDFYELMMGEEWDSALQDLQVCFFTQENVKFSAYLYWRLG